MKRLAPLFLAGVVGLAACSDDRSTPLAPDTAARSASAAESASEDHLVVMEGQRLPKDFAARMQALGGSVVAAYDAIGVAVVSGLSAETAAQLQAADDVQLVELDREIQMIDAAETEAVEAEGAESHASPTLATRYARQWNMRAIGADRAWAAGHRGSSSITVAILDTGLDYTYPDLAGRVDLSRSRSFITTSEERQLRNSFFPGMHDVVDMHGHGTHVGSTVVSNGHIVAGVTQRVTLIGVKVLSARGSGSSAGILAGIMYAADAGADVINMSLGGTFAKSAFPGFVATINRAITYANRKNVTLVVSAGNSNADLDHDGDGYKTYCSSPLTVCVSATGPTDAARSATGALLVDGPWINIDAKATYSNYGRSAVDVAAPGGNSGGFIWAACSKQRLTRNTTTNVWSRHTCSAFPANHFIIGMNGTSMASPHVAGLAALMVEKHGKNPGRVKNALHQLSDDLGELGTDPIYGKGRINVAKALGL
jgi:subtilisin family serine protease